MRTHRNTGARVSPLLLAATMLGGCGGKEPATGGCTPPCEAGYLCRDAECLQLCENDQQCPAAEACDVDVCRRIDADCVTDEDCAVSRGPCELAKDAYCEGGSCHHRLPLYCALPGEDADSDLVEDEDEHWSGTCNESRVCIACESDADCGERFCECADAACSWLQCSDVDCDCQYNDDFDGSCDGPLGEGRDDPDDTCGASLTCDGRGGCHLPRGDDCEDAQDCESGHCADGVCCETACQGTCDSCAGGETPGQCAAVPEACGGECAMCGEQDGGYDCQPSPGVCEGSCAVCGGNGMVFNCGPDATRCEGDCAACEASGGAFNCVAVPSVCTDQCAGAPCAGSDVTFNCDLSSCCATSDCAGYSGQCGHPEDQLLPSGCTFTYDWAYSQPGDAASGWARYLCTEGAWSVDDSWADGGPCPGCEESYTDTWSHNCGDGNVTDLTLTCP